MKFKILTVLLLLIIMNACENQKNTADLIVYNALVYTIDDSFTVQQAFAVKDGKFLAVGTNTAIKENYISDNMLDAQGKPVYPGFIDAHCHFYGYGYNLLKRADLVGTTSFEEVVDRLIKHHSKTNSKWIEGRGWDQNDWEIKEFPNKDLLDELFPNNPVYLTRIDGHAAIANSEALRMAGIHKDSKVQGGDILIKDG
jgi:predicted amidohydrolase YtcJ